MSEAGDIRKKSLIDGILSTEFDECSIAAADSARLAHAVFESDDEKRAVRNLQPVGRFAVDTDLLEPYDCLPVGETTIKDSLVAEGKVELVLARHAQIPDFPLGLLAVFNNDMMLPVATFAPRTDGRCSYVQLGREIVDDNLIVTPNSPRVHAVEQIRALLNDKRAYADVHLEDQEKRVYALLDELIASGLEESGASILELLGPAVRRAAERYFTESKGRLLKRKLNVLNGDSREWTGATEPMRVDARKITFLAPEDPDDLGDSTQKWPTINGRSVELLLARTSTPEQKIEHAQKKRLLGRRRAAALDDTALDAQNLGELGVFVVTRGEVAYRVARFLSSGTVFEDNLEQPLEADKLLTLMQVLSTEAEAHRNIIASWQAEYLTSRLQKMRYRRLYHDGKGFDDGYSFGDSDGSLDTSTVWSTFKDQLSKSWRLDKAHKIAMEGAAEEVMQVFCNQFSIAQRLDSYLGRGESATERVVARLGQLATGESTEHTGILERRSAGKTVTDVQTEVVLRKKEGEIRVLVRGRPVALEGFRLATLFDVVLTERGVNEIDEETTAELEGVLEEIFPPKG